MAWQFAQDAADSWRQTTEELKRTAGAGEVSGTPAIVKADF
jgi:hypothetical protein